MKVIKDFAASIIFLIIDVYESLKQRRTIAVVSVLGSVGGILAILLAFFIGSAVIQDSVQPSDLPAGTVTFVNQYGQEHKLYVEVADTEILRRDGLMFRTFLPAEQGMLFVFDDVQPRTFWMKNTFISLDIIFLDEDERVVSYAQNTKTQQTEEVYSSGFPAKFVIETNSGWVQRTNLSVGDQFELDY